MKQPLLLSFLLLFTAGTAFSQIGKGQKYLGGSLAFSYGDYGTSQLDVISNQYYTTNVTAFNISPVFGFFVSDKWSINVMPSFGWTSGTETSLRYDYINGVPQSYMYSNKYHSGVVGLSVAMRYYWMLNDKFGIYPQFGIGSTHYTNNFSSGTLSIGGSPNLVFFPSKKVGVNMGFGSLGYNYDYQNKSSSVNLNLNNNIYFGLSYYYGGK